MKIVDSDVVLVLFEFFFFFFVNGSSCNMLQKSASSEFRKKEVVTKHTIPTKVPFILIPLFDILYSF